MKGIKNFISKHPVGVGASILICVLCFAWYILANPELTANAAHVNVFANNIVVYGTTGIGTAEPGAKLEISGGTRFSYELEHDIYHMDIVPVIDGSDNVKYEFRMTDYDGLDDQAAITIRGQDGNVGINTTNPGAKLDVAGSILSDGYAVTRVKYGTISSAAQNTWYNTGLTNVEVRSGFAAGSVSVYRSTWWVGIHGSGPNYAYSKISDIRGPCVEFRTTDLKLQVRQILYASNNISWTYLDIMGD